MGFGYSDCFEFNFNFPNVKNMKEIVLNFVSEIEYVWDSGFVHGLAIGFNVCTLAVCVWKFILIVCLIGCPTKSTLVNIKLDRRK